MDTTIKPVDANVQITLLARNMLAVVTVTPPGDGGAPLDEQMLRRALEARGVKAGLDEERIAQLGEHPVYNVEFEIAKGLPAADGESGTIEYLFNTSVDLRPKEREDGTIDFRELGLIQHVDADQPLVRRVPATEGTQGYDVLGNTLKARKGRDVALPSGQNTKLSEDKNTLLAAKTGHVEMRLGRVVVLDTYTVGEDVSSATGNINFDGDVVVNGNVLGGFTIRATGNINVRKLCEAATLKAGGNVVIGEGMNGGSIEAGGDVKSKYLQSCNIKAGGNVYAESVYNCNIGSGASVVLGGSKGTLIGGSCTAGATIDAMFIGSENTYIPTRVEVGLDPALLERLQAAPREYAEAYEFIERLERTITLFEQLAAAGRLDEEKATQYRNAQYTLELERAKAAALGTEIEELQRKSQHLGFGVIIARGRIYPGVRASIGTYQLVVNEEIVRSKLTRGKDGIDVNPYYSN